MRPGPRYHLACLAPRGRVSKPLIGDDDESIRSGLVKGLRSFVDDDAAFRSSESSPVIPGRVRCR